VPYPLVHDGVIVGIGLHPRPYHLVEVIMVMTSHPLPPQSVMMMTRMTIEETIAFDHIVVDAIHRRFVLNHVLLLWRDEYPLRRVLMMWMIMWMMIGRRMFVDSSYNQCDRHHPFDTITNTRVVHVPQDAVSK